MKPFTIVIEWENARLSELVRARRMLSALRSQIAELNMGPESTPEILVLHDRLEINPETIEEVLAEAFPVGRRTADIRIVLTEGLRYYELKNFGAGLADSENVIFLDSDVIPEPGWLAGLLAALSLPEVDVVCGNTYISLDNLYSRAFALFWFFPLRSKEAALQRTDHFFANNVGFRKKYWRPTHSPAWPNSGANATRWPTHWSTMASDCSCKDVPGWNIQPPMASSIS